MALLSPNQLDVTKARKAMEAVLGPLRAGKLTVIVRKPTKIDGRTKTTETTLYSDIPCKLSFSAGKTEEEDQTSTSSAGMVLFVAPDIIIPDGSKCIVKQHGAEYALTSARVKGYESHKEYDVAMFDGWL